MKTLWRISNHLDLSGWGGRKYSSRWSSLGKRVVYMAESPAGAMLEILVHLRGREEELPRTFALLEIEAPEHLAARDILPLADADWKEQAESTQRIGDAWLASRETPLARVPSAIMPRTWNFLLNPEHPDAEQIKILSVIRERFDNRLFRFGTR
jgi:RES domain-containing protein